MAFTSNIKRFARDSRGNIALITGLLAVPLIGAVGVGVDYGAALVAQHQLNAAAFSAAAAAANTARSGITRTQTATTTSSEDSGQYYSVGNAITDGQSHGVSHFKAHMGAMKNTNLSADPTVAISQNGNILTATVSYTATQPSTISQVFGIKQFTLHGSGSATLGYVDKQTNTETDLINESFETLPSAMANGNWGVYPGYNNWKTLGPGVEVGQASAYGVPYIPDGKNIAELDSNANTSMSKKVYMKTGTYELRWFYYSRVPTGAYTPIWICGSQASDLQWSTAPNDWFSNVQTNRLAVYVDQATSDNPPATYWDAGLNRYRFDASINNMIDGCVTSGQKWLERSQMITINNPGYYWVTFQAEGANDSYGGLIDNVRLCVGTCAGTPQDNFPWAQNTVLFTDTFNRSGSGTCNIFASGSSPGWTSPADGWNIGPMNDVECWIGAGANGSGEIEMEAYYNPTKRIVSRRFMLDPGYYELDYYFINRVNMPNFNGTYCGQNNTQSQAAYISSMTLNSSTQPYVYEASNGGANYYLAWTGWVTGFVPPINYNTNWTNVYVDNDQLYSHVVSLGASQFGNSWYANSDGSTTNLMPKMPGTMIDSCAYSSSRTLRQAKFKITKPGYYWVSFNAEGQETGVGGHLSSVSLIALGGPSMSAPSSYVTIPAPGTAVGNSIVMNGIQIVEN